MSLQGELLNRYKIDVRNKSMGQFKMKCPECQPPHNSSDRPLSVTIESTSILFLCHHCDYKGGVNEQMRMIDTPPRINGNASFMQKFFSERCISQKTIDDFNITSSDEWILFPYNGKVGDCDNIKYRKKDKQFKQSKDGKKSLYNYERCKNADCVLFVEGEMDAASVYESGFHSVTTLPDGAPSKTAYRENDKRFLPLQTCPLKASKIILFCDADGAGDNLKKELIHRYGKKKCWFIKPPTGCKDANDVLVTHGVEALKVLIENARPVPVDGLYTVANYYEDVIDLYHDNYAKPVDIGLSGLDGIYKVMKGTFHVWTGIPNHGKSTFLDQCLVSLANKHGWRFAVFSPEHSTKMHVRRLLQLKVQKPFDSGFNGRMSEAEAMEGMRWIQKHFYFIETREHIPTADKILDLAKVSIQKYGCNGLVIDPYNEVDASRKGTYREDEHIRDFISKCKRFCKMHEVVTWVVAHPTKLPKETDGYRPPTAYDISGASHWHNQADAVVVVHRDFENDTIQVITRKIREQGMYGQIGEVRFTYDYKIRSFVPITNIYN